MEDTEWTDALKKYGIIKDEPKPKDPEPEQSKCPKKDKNFSNENIDDIFDLDNEDDDVIEEYRRKRFAEMKMIASLPKFGDVREITAVDYLDQVNKAGDSVWVVLLLFEYGIPLCTLLCDYFNQLACKFPHTKFLKSQSKLCIENFPEHNLPAIFIYYNGNLIKQLIGKEAFVTPNVPFDVLEWILSETGAIKTSLERDPRKGIESKKLFSTSLLTNSTIHDDSDHDD